jgi:hypothetical protein
MKKIILLIAILATTSQGNAVEFFEPFTFNDWILLGANEMLLIADWNQTKTIVRNPEHHRETNLLLGNHPSMHKLDAYMSILLIANPLVVWACPKEIRPYFQFSVFSVELHCVSYNMACGLSTHF